MRTFLTIYVLVIAVTVSILGFRGSLTEKEPVEVFNDMDRQAKYKPQAENSFHANRQNDRLPPKLTMSRGNALDVKNVFNPEFTAKSASEELVLSGKGANGEFSDIFPYSVDFELMQYGQESYNIFCMTCHGVAGDGNGVTKPYGILATSYHDDRLRDAPDGYIYDVITNGKGLMYGLKDRLSNKQRWAIVLYLRALQRSQSASLESLSTTEKSELGL
ncbi:MAG: cytochrome c [Verrucomicrobia bacterium]|nr:cytochrome c [Verrucomicrobiota bacterium]